MLDHQVSKIEKRVVDAEPKHGLTWSGVAKAPANLRASVADILKKTAAKLTVVPPK